MELLVLIGLATIFYTLFDIFASKASGRMDANLSSVIFNGIGALVPLVIYAWYKVSKGSSLLPAERAGILYSLLAGVSIAVFSILLIRIFERGGLAYVTPLIYGGTIVLASTAGWLVFKEEVGPLSVAGVLVIAVGIGMVVAAKA